jgi:CheY-like chemotaxis protein
VLVVEDHADSRDVIRQRLETLGVRVLGAAGGHGARLRNADLAFIEMRRRLSAQPPAPSLARSAIDETVDRLLPPAPPRRSREWWRWEIRVVMLMSMARAAGGGDWPVFAVSAVLGAAPRPSGLSGPGIGRRVAVAVA